MKMNKRQQEIENIRLELFSTFIKDDPILYVQLSNITGKLWDLSHRLTKWQSLQVRVKQFFGAL